MKVMNSPQSPEAQDPIQALNNQNSPEMAAAPAHFDKTLNLNIGLTEDTIPTVEVARSALQQRLHSAIVSAATLEAAGVRFNSSESDTGAPESELLHPDLILEQSKHAAEVIAAMEDKFPGKTFELIKLPENQDLNSPDSKETLEPNEPTKPNNRFTVICSDPLGVDLGDPEKDYDPKRSFRDITAVQNDPRFIVEISDGSNYDTRLGITFETYNALIKHAKATDKPLPDIEPITINGSRFNTWTHLTGENSDRVHSLVVGFSGGFVVRNIAFLDDNGRDLRFRPAVMLDFSSVE